MEEFGSWKFARFFLGEAFFGGDAFCFLEGGGKYFVILEYVEYILKVEHHENFIAISFQLTEWVSFNTKSAETSHEDPELCVDATAGVPRESWDQFPQVLEVFFVLGPRKTKSNPGKRYENVTFYESIFQQSFHIHESSSIIKIALKRTLSSWRRLA